jgi:hypothetical protein
MIQKEESGRNFKTPVQTFQTEKAGNYSEIMEALISSYPVNDASLYAFPK